MRRSKKKIRSGTIEGSLAADHFEYAEDDSHYFDDNQKSYPTGSVHRDQNQ